MSQVDVDLLISNEYELKIVKNEIGTDRTTKSCEYSHANYAGSHIKDENETTRPQTPQDPLFTEPSSNDDPNIIPSISDIIRNFELELRPQVIALRPFRTENGQVTIKCGNCAKPDIFQNLDDVIWHSIRKHRENWSVSCRICPTLLKFDFSDLLSHAESHFQCTEEQEIEKNLVINDNKALKNENRTNVPTRRAKQEVNFDLENESESEFNEKNSKKSKKFAKKCKICLKTFATVANYRRHTLIHTGVKPYTCDICEKSFNQAAILKTHLLTHQNPEKRATDSKKYHCLSCDKSFYKKFDLNVHERTHTLEKPFQCDFCPKNFAQKSALRRHLYTHTGEKPFLCTFCGRRFTQPGILKLHLVRAHTLHTKYKIEDLKKFECTICNKKFFKPFDLKIHIRVHTNEKPYQCEVCPKSFAQKGGLRKHLYTHKEDIEKPHKCPHCIRCYVQLFDLHNHILTHTGEQPYRCPDCHRGFSSKGNLLRHQTVHSGEKRFSCDRCGKEFSQLCSLADHINVHTGARPYSCTQCTKSFANRSTLVKHVQALHEGKRQKKSKAPSTRSNFASNIGSNGLIV